VFAWVRGVLAVALLNNLTRHFPGAIETPDRARVRLSRILEIEKRTDFAHLLYAFGLGCQKHLMMIACSWHICGTVPRELCSHYSLVWLHFQEGTLAPAMVIEIWVQAP
jgi:hypothetical protein